MSRRSVASGLTVLAAAITIVVFVTDENLPGLMARLRRLTSEWTASKSAPPPAESTPAKPTGTTSAQPKRSQVLHTTTPPPSAVRPSTAPPSAASLTATVQPAASRAQPRTASLKLVFELKDRPYDSAAIAPNAQYIATATGWRKPALILDTHTRTTRAKIPSDSHWITALSFAPDGKTLASSHTSGKVYVWTLDARKLATFDCSRGASAVTFNPTGELLAAMCDGAVTVWSVKTGRRTASLEATAAGNVAFGAQGYLAVSGRPARLWRIDSVDAAGAVLDATISAESYTRSVALSRNAALLAGASTEQTWVVDVQSRTVVDSWPMGRASAGAVVAFSPTDSLLAWAYHDTLLLRDVQAGVNLDVVKFSNWSSSWTLSFSADSQHLVTTSHSSSAGTRSLRLWRVER